MSYQPLNLGGVEGGSAKRPPEALRRSRNFFFSYLVAISFPIEFDVWGRLCTHFETVKVMTFAPVTQHFIVSPFVKKKFRNFFFCFGKGEAGRIVKEIREDTDFAQYSRKEE